MNTCNICGKIFVDKALDDPLHCTNWNLPNRRTFDVCSELCKEIVFERYELGLKIDIAKSIASLEEKRDLIKDVKYLLDSYLAGNNTPSTLTEINVNRLFRDLKMALEDYDD